MMDAEATQKTEAAARAAMLIHVAVLCVEGMLEGWSVEDVAEEAEEDPADMRCRLECAIEDLLALVESFERTALSAEPAERR